MVVVARGADRLNEAAEAIHAATGRETLAIVADLADPATPQRVMEAVLERFGRLDILVNCVGGMGQTKILTEQDDAAWDYHYQAVFMSHVRMCREALPHMPRGGSIVNVSAYSIRAQIPALVSYTAMKSALSSMSKNLSKVAAPLGVRVNVVCPGATLTASGDERAENERTLGTPLERTMCARIRDDFGMIVDMERMGTAQELANAIVFLASDAASYITGAALNVDGGKDF